MPVQHSGTELTSRLRDRHGKILTLHQIGLIEGRIGATVKAVKETAKAAARRVLWRLEAEACVQLNLTPSADSREYSTDVAGETPRNVFEDGVSISAKG